MKKQFFLALTLLCSVLALTSCNKEDDPQHPLHNIKFYCDYERNGIMTEFFYFGSDNNCQYGWEHYADQTKKEMTFSTVDYGTYNLYDAYIDLSFTKQVRTENGKSETIDHSYKQRVYYVLKDNTLTLTFNKGEEGEYSIEYYK